MKRTCFFARVVRIVCFALDTLARQWSNKFDIAFAFRIFAPMNRMVDIFAILGKRLDGFGKTPDTAAVIDRAATANPWFLPQEIVRAVEAVRSELLERQRLEEWASAYSPVRTPKRILVVMAGNIPLVGFFDMLCVLMSGHTCLVKPSSKDAVLMGYIIDSLRSIDPDIPLRLSDGEERPDAVVATGSDNANRYFRTMFGGIPSLLRGSRQSVAVLSGEETAAELSGLEEDIFAYSGLGCRNVSLLFLPRGYLPRLHCTARNEKYRRNYLQERAVLRMLRTPFIDLNGAVLREERSFPTALSRIHYTFYDTLSEAEEWLAAHDGELQCVVSRCVTHSRRVDFGCAQHPGLTDYADDVDTMRFLGAI